MIGLDISDRSIKIAEVSATDPPRLQTVCWSSIPTGVIKRGVIQDVPVVINAVEEAFTKCSPVPVTGREVVASIPEMRSFVRVIELPTMSNEETQEAISWAVKQHIPFDLDRVYLDWQRLPGSPNTNKQSILVGVTQKDVVDPLLDVLDAVGLEVRALELEAQSIVRSLLPLQATDIQGVLIIDLGATATNIIYFHQGAIRFTSSVQFGGDDLTNQLAQAMHLQPSVAAEQKALVGIGGTTQQNGAEVATALRQGIVELMRRIEKMVRDINPQLQIESYVQTILLAGGAANLPGIQSVFTEVFPNIPVQMGNPWTNIISQSSSKTPPLSPQDASHFATALGLALRQEEGV